MRHVSVPHNEDNIFDTDQLRYVISQAAQNLGAVSLTTQRTQCKGLA